MFLGNFVFSLFLFPPVFLFLSEDSCVDFRRNKFVVKWFKWIGNWSSQRPLTCLPCGLREFVNSKEKLEMILQRWYWIKWPQGHVSFSYNLKMSRGRKDRSISCMWINQMIRKRINLWWNPKSWTSTLSIRKENQL